MWTKMKIYKKEDYTDGIEKWMIDMGMKDGRVEAYEMGLGSEHK